MHLGNAFSALLAWVQARAKDGEFVLRLENLDERCRPSEYTELLLEDLAWLGIDWDGEPIMQADRLAAYDEALDRIMAAAEVYPCFCTRADLHVASAPHASDGSVLYPGTCSHLEPAERAVRASSQRHALRLHVPDMCIAFDDAIQGEYAQNLRDESGDFVLRRSDGVYAYQLVCVVDDIFSGVTDVVRGRDLLSSTPRQMYLQQLLGADAPRYAHHPLLVAPDGRRLSKRDGDLEIAALRERGVKAEDIVGYLANLAGLIERNEPMTADELRSMFDANALESENITVSPESLRAQGFVQ